MLLSRTFLAFEESLEKVMTEKPMRGADNSSDKISPIEANMSLSA